MCANNETQTMSTGDIIMTSVYSEWHKKYMIILHKKKIGYLYFYLRARATQVNGSHLVKCVGPSISLIIEELKKVRESMQHGLLGSLT